MFGCADLHWVAALVFQAHVMLRRSVLTSLSFWLSARSLYL